MIRLRQCRPALASTMKTIGKALLLALVLAAASAAQAQKSDDVTDMQALRQAVRNDKRAFVESMMNLNAAEAKRFWPIYQAYQREVDLNNRRRNVTSRRTNRAAGTPT